MIVVLLIPTRAAPAVSSGASARLFDFCPVFRNRSAMAYALAYCIHTWEMNALRGWAVYRAASLFIDQHTAGLRIET